MNELIIEKICQLPVSFIKENKSIYDLLEDSGYFDNPNIVTTSLIKDYLENNKEVINKWLIYSSDKRTSSGWYFTESDKHGKYIVGYLNNGNRRNETEFSDIDNACATFILNEIESIKTNR